MDRYLLRYFLAVIDQGTFSKAAAACHVSQPTLSVGIAKLEQALGKPLFHRTSRRIELTPAGATLLPHARRIEAEFARAERRVRGAAAARVVRLGLVTTLPPRWIEGYLGRLRAYAPEERVEIVEGRKSELTERLGRGRIDAALTVLRGDEERPTHRPLVTEGYSLALSVRHRLAGRHAIDAEELFEEPMIVRHNCELLSETSRFFTARGVRPFFPARTASEERALAYVRNGLGITIMPNGFEAEGVARVRLAGFDFVRHIGLLFGSHVEPGGLLARPALRLLEETITAAAKDHSPNG